MKIKGLYLVRVGSTVTCNPVPENTDKDYLCYFKTDNIDNQEVVKLMVDNGFQYEGKFYAGSDSWSPFRSWRKKNDNIIITNDHKFYHRFLLATELAKRFNLLDKEDRIALFQGMLYNESYPYHTIRRKNNGT